MFMHSLGLSMVQVHMDIRISFTHMVEFVMHLPLRISN